MSRFFCEIEGCSLRAYKHFLVTDLSLCRWHSYLFKLAGSSGDEPTCQHLLDRLPAQKRAAEKEASVM